MSWATRATLIFILIWGGFWLLILGPGSNPYAFSLLWWKGMALLVGVPAAFLWAALFLVMGNRGALR